MQHQILINVIIFVAYVLNLPLNTQRSHSRSQRAAKWSLILAHDRRPIYRAPTYFAVLLLGPHQPRYIGITLYLHFISFLHIDMTGSWDPFSSKTRTYLFYGNARSQGISNHDIYCVQPINLVPARKGLTLRTHLQVNTTWALALIDD